MFTKSAAFYDAIYSWKDYEAESARLHDLISQYKKSAGSQLLDVACGTGGHIPHLQQHYQVAGLDLDDSMLDVARAKFPDVTFYHADMVDFDLGKQYDVIVCLFSSIGYVKTVGALNRTLATFKRHLRDGGVVIVEPWLERGMIRDGALHMKTVDEPELKITRINQTRVEGDLTILDFYYLMGTPAGVEYFTEQHELAMFTRQEYEAAFVQAGFSVTTAELSGRGLYIGF